MKTNVLVLAALTVIPSVIVFVEVFLFLPVVRAAQSVKDTGFKAFRLIRSRRISDHWKEKVLLRYARTILLSTLQLVLLLGILLSSFVLIFCLTGLFFYEDLHQTISSLLSLQTQIIAVGVGVLYAFLRKRIASRQSKGDYSPFSKTLHYLALSSSAVKRMAFDVDCQMAKSRSLEPEAIRPVFVAGLARAGTTILLQALYSTNVFATLTYRDMPFAMAPFLWKKLTSGNRKQGELKERAHGDRLKVNYDSPEAFEEIFWLTFLEKAYIRESFLEPHSVGSRVIEDYRKLVSNVVRGSGDENQVRYLAKNNNNLLRIQGIKEAFPDAVILVPFRNPFDHANSLLTQHTRFTHIHKEDAFSLRYMNWLGHHEFGLNFKPLKFSENAIPLSQEETFTLDYWLRYWMSIYQYVADTHISDVVLFDYDRFCTEPRSSLTSLARLLGIEDVLISRFQESVKKATKHVDSHFNQSLLGEAERLHRRLATLAWDFEHTPSLLYSFSGN